VELENHQVQGLVLLILDWGGGVVWHLARDSLEPVLPLI